MIQSESTYHNWQPLDPEISAEDLTHHLAQAAIPTSEWGRGDAKTVEHLLSEIRNGESQISISPGGRDIRRVVRVAWVDVFHLAADGTVLNLHESRQEYNDGRVRRRNLNASLGEKMQPGEKPVDAATRALQEELGVEEPDTLYFLGESEKTQGASESYPGLPSRYATYSYVATLGAAAFKANGYIEVQPDKTNYYEWLPAS